MCAKPVKPSAKTAAQAQVETTGHEWDGIHELNNPLPRWWVWVFYLTIVWGIGYTVVYPAWPLLDHATQGIWGGSTRAEVASDIEAFDKANADIKARLVAADLEAIEKDEELASFARAAGKSLFANNCATCHGSGAAGVQGKGYPNLLDNDWLWGGDMTAIHTTITHGIRNTTNPDARTSEMPKFAGTGADDALLTKEQIAAVVEHVLALSGQEADAALVSEGATIFADNCASCHGDAGLGNRDLGAPNLTDAIWLYGGDRETVTTSVSQARFGVMPAWGAPEAGKNGKLSEDQIRALAFYVHGLGGGE